MISFSTPNIASSKDKLIVYSKSAPLTGPFLLLDELPPPPKKLSKISPKPPISLKSKPPNPPAPNPLPSKSADPN